MAEITGAARSMRNYMLPVEAPAGAIDLCGTGGDGHGTLNISTAVSFVVAAAGVPVAKHGNRAASSKSGAADILEALGVKIGLEPQTASRVLAETGIVFLFAQTHHPAMKHVGAARKQIGRRTIFNLLGTAGQPGAGDAPAGGNFRRGMADALCRGARRHWARCAPWLCMAGTGWMK